MCGCGFSRRSQLRPRGRAPRSDHGTAPEDVDYVGPRSSHVRPSPMGGRHDVRAADSEGQYSEAVVAGSVGPSVAGRAAGRPCCVPSAQPEPRRQPPACRCSLPRRRRSCACRTARHARPTARSSRLTSRSAGTSSSRPTTSPRRSRRHREFRRHSWGAVEVRPLARSPLRVGDRHKVGKLIHEIHVAEAQTDLRTSTAGAIQPRVHGCLPMTSTVSIL